MALTRRSPLVGDLSRIGDDAAVPVAVLIELNQRYPGSTQTLTREFFRTWVDAVPGPVAQVRRTVEPGVPAGLRFVTTQIYQAVITRAQVAALVGYDRSPDRGRPATVFKVWPDYQMVAHTDRSAPTIQADAARRTFAATGRGIVWAVIDSGIDAAHPHFAGLGLSDDLRRDTPGTGPLRETASATYGLHRDFTDLVWVAPDPEALPGVPAPDAPAVGQPAEQPLTDLDGHGTHVAGIIAGRCPRGSVPHVAAADEPDHVGNYVPRVPTGALAGMARECELVSLKVLRRNANGMLVTSSAAVLRALDYLLTEVNTDREVLKVHGVNLSLGCDWDAAHYAAGRSPVCQAIDALTAAGVVVVVSAGNGGQGQAANRNDTMALLGTISEPAHAQSCIAVGSTHREAPERFGVTYTSGKGPTLDGRCKPDVVAPGEWITSAATGALRRRSGLAALPPDTANPTLTYAPDSGTSMAAPHVSGAIAALLSVRPGLVGDVAKVKQLVCETATDLHRERYAQGHGLVDVLRMLGQS